jgi:lipoate-protein ligase A
VAPWEVARSSQPPSYALAGEPAPSRRVIVRSVRQPTLVLGSTQPETLVDVTAVRAAGVEVVRRRSGGGVVLLQPGRVMWLDVVLPAGDGLWDEDVGRSFGWLGTAWAAAIGALDIPAAVHEGRPQCTGLGRRVCFAALSWGEVTSGGRKVVGVSQRRTRQWALFQCAALISWEPGALLALLALSDDERALAATELETAAVGLDVDPRLLEQAFLEALPQN